MSSPGDAAHRQPEASPARQATLRELNLALVFGVILDAAGEATGGAMGKAAEDAAGGATGSAPSAQPDVEPHAGAPSRADISAATGLTRATVSTLVDALVAGGLVTELAPVAPRKAGRPAIPLVPSSGTVAGLGAEISVDHLALRAIDLAGHVVAERHVAGSFRDSVPEPVLRRLGAEISQMRETLEAGRVRVAGIGIAVPGLVESATGLLRLAPNLGWRDVDLRGSLWSDARVTDGLSVVVGNEANLAALAESTALRSLSDDAEFAYVNGDVGIGAAILAAGQVFEGAHGWSGEIGHVVIEPNGPVCRCGARGCLEQYAGQEILMARAGLGTGGALSELIAAARSEDQVALDALATAGDALGIALANLTNLMDVDHVVLGGILAPLEPWLRAPILRQLSVRVLASPWATPTLSAARVGDLPALTGAAMSALLGVRADPATWLAEN